MNQPEYLHVCRRDFFQRTGLGLGGIALSSLLREASGAAPANPLAARQPHFAPRAKHIIYLHMIGAPSQLDLFDHKPALAKYDGQPCPEELTRGKRFAFLGGKLTLAASRSQF